MGKKKKKYEVFIYDTDEDDQDMELLDPSEQRLRLRMEKKNRGGKMVTVIDGFEGLGIDDLSKKLKSHCGVGGSSKDGLIVLQGDVRKKAIEYLIKLGYKDVK